MALVAVAYLNHGRWVADCPRPGCANAEMAGLDGKGHPGGLGDWFRCRPEEGGCGLRCEVIWPGNVEDIEALVIPRPLPATRNWNPGQSLHELLAENLEHGVVPITREAIEAGRETPRGCTPLLEIVGESITPLALEG
jgi:hypothetical protein